MTFKLGYLIPTREQILNSDHSARGLIDRAALAHELGFDSVWIGDSLLARPRHDPLTLMAAIGATVPEITIGTAVLLPMLRNPVLLAHQIATVDQICEGRVVIGAGIAADNRAIRQEFAAAGVPFEKRVGTLLEGFRLCRALWSGDAVDWTGRWTVANGTLAPIPFTSGGPPIWLASSVSAGIERAAQHFDGWFPIGPNLETFAEHQSLYQDALRAEDKNSHTTAIYLTVSIDDNGERADQAINQYLESYYNAPASVMRRFQSCFGGSLEKVCEFVRGYVDAGADHVVLRLVGDHIRALPALADALRDRAA
jgi:alkanesulfonate monooxygenase SsuD/methylene tetrahydromethanopterin reductase-like flavin-dependent oxidoreductase (luciferase family)